MEVIAFYLKQIRYIALILGYLVIVQVHADVGSENIQIDVNHGWTPLFFGFAGVGVPVYNAWLTPCQSHHGQADGCFSSVGALTHFRQKRHLRSHSVDNWTKLNVDLVKLELFLKGHRKAWIIFDGRNTNITDWFSHEKLMASNYKDLFYGKYYDEFSMEGHDHAGGRFVISETRRGCRNIVGWLFVVDSSYGICNQGANYGKFPAFYYSTLNAKSSFSGTSIGSADLLTISIKTHKIEEKNY